MAEQNIKSRIQHKHDTEANWNKAVNFIPLKGEIIVYDTDSNVNYERMKIGDGVTTIINLPFYLASEIESIRLEMMSKVEVSFDSTNNLLVFTN